MVKNGALSHKIDYIEEILNLEGHQNCTTGSRVTAILLNAWIFLLDKVVEGLLSTGPIPSSLEGESVIVIKILLKGISPFKHNIS